jgi:hypothetical protein
LSEFINFYQRLEFNRYKEEYQKGRNFTFKRDYKKTDDFQNINELIISITRKILGNTEVINSRYLKHDIHVILSGLNERKIDFNDLHIEKICKQNNFFLLTDDGDFRDSDINIISGNQKLFNNTIL